MKVLFHANIPSPYRVEFFDLLAEKIDLTVVYERRSASDRETDWYVDDNKKYKIYYLNGINYSNDASFAPGIIKLLKKEKFDIFVISGYSSLTQMIAITTLKVKRIPYILNVDGGVIRERSGFKYWYKRELISGATCYLSTGKMCDDYLMNYGASKDKLRRYPFTSIMEKDILKVPLTEVEKEFYKQKVQCKYKKMILSVGQPIHRKGFDILVKAMAKIDDPNIGVYIVGGEPNEECVALFNQHKLKTIHFISFMKKDVLADYYKAADLFVFPTREDIWGLVINEAMSYGLPVITTDKCNAGLELVKNKSNLVPANKSDELASRIQEVIHGDKLDDMARESLDVISGYSFEKMVERHIEIFEGFFYNNKKLVKKCDL